MNEIDLINFLTKASENNKKYDHETIESINKMKQALEKQIPKRVYHFLNTGTFETTCCGIDVTNKDYNYCPNCGRKLGEVVEVEE